MKNLRYIGPLPKSHLKSINKFLQMICNETLDLRGHVCACCTLQSFWDRSTKKEISWTKKDFRCHQVYELRTVQIAWIMLTSALCETALLHFKIRHRHYAPIPIYRDSTIGHGRPQLFCPVPAATLAGRSWADENANPHKGAKKSFTTTKTLQFSLKGFPLNCTSAF